MKIFSNGKATVVLTVTLILARLTSATITAFAPIVTRTTTAKNVDTASATCGVQRLASIKASPLICTREKSAMFMSNEQEEPPTTPVEPEGTKYPVDLPSPFLFATSVILAIASTGSVFELAGGNPQFGFIPTAAIATVGLPTCLFLFYAAILKGTAETEEDDKKFMNRNNSQNNRYGR